MLARVNVTVAACSSWPIFTSLAVCVMRRCFELLERLARDGLGEMPAVSSITTPIEAKRYLKRYMLCAFDDASDSDTNEPGESEGEQDLGPIRYSDQEDEEEEDEEEGGSGNGDPDSPQAYRDLSDSDDEGGSSGSADA